MQRASHNSAGPAHRCLQVPDYVFLEDGKVLIGTNQAW